VASRGAWAVPRAFFIQRLDGGVAQERIRSAGVLDQLRRALPAAIVGQGGHERLALVFSLAYLMASLSSFSSMSILFLTTPENEQKLAIISAESFRRLGRTLSRMDTRNVECRIVRQGA
jgi:hypothetical protein